MIRPACYQMKSFFSLETIEYFFADVSISSSSIRFYLISE